MADIYVRNYSSMPFGNDGGTYYGFQKKGAAIAAAAAYPTGDSRSSVACRQAVEIGIDSFLHRPSVSDEAVRNISSFINDAIFIYQEPDKEFLCSSALCFIIKAKARFVISGNAAVYHYRNRVMVQRRKGVASLLLGQKLHWKEEAEPEVDITDGDNAFVLCSAADSVVLPEVIPDSVFDSSMDITQWTDAVVSYFKNIRCSVIVIAFAHKRSFLEKKMKEVGL